MLTSAPVLENKHAWLLLIAFIAGQLVQLILQATGMNFGLYYQIRFCIAGGFIIAFVFFMGMLVDARTRPAKVKEPENEDKAD